MKQKTLTVKQLEFFGWLLVPLVPLLVYNFLLSQGVDHNQNVYLSIMSSAIIIWTLQLLPEYVPVFFIIGLSLIYELAPDQIILNGFASQTFLLVLSFFCITIVVMDSGLNQRLLFFTINFFQKSKNAIEKSFYYAYLFLTPFLPSNTVRAELGAKAIVQFDKDFRQYNQSMDYNHLINNVFHGSTHFSTVIYSGSLMNFFLLNFLPLQDQIHFSFIGWCQAGIVSGFVILLGYWVLEKIFFKDSPDYVIGGKILMKDARMITISQVLDQEKKSLKAITSKEKTAAYVVLVSFISLATYPLHRVPVAWIIFVCVGVIMALNLLNKRNFQEKTNWTFLIYLACISSIVSMMNYFNFKEYFIVFFKSYLLVYQLDVYTIHTLIIILVLLLRLFLPTGVVLGLLIPVSLPLCQLLSINFWTVMFTILTIADLFFLPYQSPIYTNYKSFLEEEPIDFDEKRFLKINVYVNLIRILSIYASIFYWENFLKIN